jgi:hypothetical protein
MEAGCTAKVMYWYYGMPVAARKLFCCSVCQLQTRCNGRFQPVKTAGPAENDGLVNAC